MTEGRGITQQEDQGLVVTGTVELPVSVEQAVEQWTQYQELVRRLLDASDYQTIRGKKFPKKSAWRKLARAFNIADQIVERHIIRDEATGRGIEADFLVRATAPNGRYADGWASCSIYERAHEEDDKWPDGNVKCAGPCDGRRHFSNPDHDVPATAHTRAKNRAIADLIGAGEVSAEEMDQPEPDQPEPVRKLEAPAKALNNGGKVTRFYRTLLQELKLDQEQVMDLLGFEKPSDCVAWGREQKVATLGEVLTAVREVMAGPFEPKAEPVVEAETDDVELEEISF